jgi:TonB family protein
MRNIYLTITLLIFFAGTSFSTGTCHSCKGSGKLQCDYCVGYGYMGACDRCDGLGMLEEVCHTCNGSRFVSEPIGNNQFRRRACPSCNGAGSIREKCTRCIGTGHNNKCMTCLGTGTVQCRSCNGSGNTFDQMDTLGSVKNQTMSMDNSPKNLGQDGIDKYGALQDTIHVPMVIRQINLDESTSLSLAAEDTIKPKSVSIIFASEDSVKDGAVTILNPYRSDIIFSQGTKPSFSNVVKQHRIVGFVELSWENFEQLLKINPMRIVTKRRTFDLNSDELEIISSFHKYLVERLEEDRPPPDFVEYEAEPTLLYRAEPEYPPEALRAGIQADVFVKVWVDPKGKVRKAVLLKSTSEAFNKSALEASQKWIFTPAKMKGKAVSVWISIPFRFRLNKSK